MERNGLREVVVLHRNWWTACSLLAGSGGSACVRARLLRLLLRRLAASRRNASSLGELLEDDYAIEESEVRFPTRILAWVSVERAWPVSLVLVARQAALDEMLHQVDQIEPQEELEAAELSVDLLATVRKHYHVQHEVWIRPTRHSLARVKFPISVHISGRAEWPEEQGLEISISEATLWYRAVLAVLSLLVQDEAVIGADADGRSRVQKRLVLDLGATE